MTEDEAAQWVTPEEFAAAQGFLRERRRREYLTWRAVVRRELGADVTIGYNAAGAPVVGDGRACVGVSHCAGRVAVCLSATPCAVDIEPESRDFSRALPRYISPEERALSADPLFPAVVWCAKEALYKYAGRPGLDMLRDLRIDAVDFGAGTVTGRIGSEKPVGLRLRRSEGYIIVYIM